MSNKRKDRSPGKGSKIRTNKDDEPSARSNLTVQHRSGVSPKSGLKMSSKSGKTLPQQLPKAPANLNESTYGTLPEAKGFSTSIYKKIQQQALVTVPAESVIKEDSKQLTHATHYLNSKGFRVLDKVGSGNYAKVYRVINPENKELAVKVIDLAKTSQNYRVKFLPRELDILSRLHHRNIAKIFEIIQLPKLIYIFMEYTPNGTVADFLRVYRAIPENFCQVMFHRIIDALHYLHRNNISHRDLNFVIVPPLTSSSP